jgi:hypothetical protein
MFWLVDRSLSCWNNFLRNVDYMMNKMCMSDYYPSLPMKLIHNIIAIPKVLIKNTSTNPIKWNFLRVFWLLIFSNLASRNTCYFLAYIEYLSNSCITTISTINALKNTVKVLLINSWLFKTFMIYLYVSGAQY